LNVSSWTSASFGTIGTFRDPFAPDYFDAALPASIMDIQKKGARNQFHEDRSECQWFPDVSSRSIVAHRRLDDRPADWKIDR
jgi:hypothetical protein